MYHEFDTLTLSPNIYRNQKYQPKCLLQRLRCPLPKRHAHGVLELSFGNASLLLEFDPMCVSKF